MAALKKKRKVLVNVEVRPSSMSEEYLNEEAMRDFMAKQPHHTPREHAHYFKRGGFQEIDVYRVLLMFGITDPCIQHAIKKLLVAGGRGTKDIHKDIHEAIVSLTRWEEMRTEESRLEPEMGL